MAQYTTYTSGDASAPTLYGAVGSLLTLLDAVLVNGYGSKAAAGWTKPIANSGNIGHYKQGAGSGFFVLVNDNGPNATSVAREAWAVGWETMASIAASVGTGTGQFPTPAQLLTTGHVVVRKSATADSTNARAWICFADSRTFYLFIASGDTSGMYHALWFGDLYSIKTTADTFNCFILGNNTENSTAASVSPWDLQNLLTTAGVGQFIARDFGGAGTSLTMGKHGDYAKAGAATMLGLVPAPNGADSAYYLSPVWGVQAATGQVRGRLRGMYQVCHAIASFTDGQTFNGSGTFAGKTFRVVLKGYNSGMVAVETSNTLETN